MSSRPASRSRRISLRRTSGCRERGMRLEVRQQPIAVLREPEEVVLLLDPLGRQRRMERAFAVHEVLFLAEGLARHAVPALVDALVDVAGLVAALGQLLHRGPVPRLRGADEVVEGNSQLRPSLAEHLLHVRAVLQRILARLPGLLVDVLRVLVVAHQEVRVHAARPLVAGDDVGRHLLVGLAEVGPAVHVVDGRCEVEAHAWVPMLKTNR